MKKIIYIDMDGVLVDLDSEIKKTETKINGKMKFYGVGFTNLFKDPQPMSGAIEAFEILRKSPKYDVYVLSSAPWQNPATWTYKRLWVEKYLGKSAFKRLILSHHKNLCAGDYLIDDRLANGSDKFNGELIQFGTKNFENWSVILKYLQP